MALDVNKDFHHLSTSFSYYIDTEEKLTFSEILDNQHLEFTDYSTKGIPTFYQPTTVWLKLDLHFDPQVTSDRYYIFCLQSNLFELEVYRRQKEGSFSQLKTGNLYPFKQREILSPKYGFTVDPSIAQQTVYIRFTGGVGNHRLPWVIVNESTYQSESKAYQLIILSCYSAISAIFLFNIGFLIIVRNKEYCAYSLYILFGALGVLSVDGLAYAFLWPELISFNQKAGEIFVLLSAIARLLAIYYFLNIKTESVLIHYVMIVIITALVLGIIILISFDRMTLPLWHTGLLWFASILCGLFMCGFGIYRRIPLAIPLFFILVVPTVFTFFQALAYWGVLEPSAKNLLFALYGFVLHILLFSLCIGIHMRYETDRRVMAQESLLRAYQQVFQLKSDFLTAVSHELRTPMNGVFGSLQLLRKDKEEDNSSLLYSAWISAKDLMRLINDLLSFSEIQSQQISIRNDLFNFDEATGKLQKRYRQLCADKGVNFEWHVDSDMPDQLVGDREKTLTVISKLVDNAVKFASKGEVIFHASLLKKEDGHVSIMLEVKDSGIGMSEKEMETIFESFKQRECGLRRSYGGLGIGLSITKGLIEALKGSITIESEKGRGTTAKVYLDFQYIEQKLVESDLSSLDDVTEKLPVLIVEDNKVNQQILVKMLAKMGCDSIVANNGIEALAVLEENKLSVILMDLQMPRMDGLECSRRIKAYKDERKNIPIIAVTGNAMEFNLNDCAKVGIKAYITKPIDFTTLEKVVRAYMVLDRGENNTGNCSSFKTL